MTLFWRRVTSFQNTETAVIMTYSVSKKRPTERFQREKQVQTLKEYGDIIESFPAKKFDNLHKLLTP